MLSQYKYLIIAGIALFILGTTYLKGRNDERDKWKLEVAEQVDKARLTEKELQRKADDNAKQAIKDKADLQSKLTIALNSLRSRPERMPEAARANCSGATGKELSRQDAESFIGLAYDCQRESIALDACYKHVDSLVCGQ